MGLSSLQSAACLLQVHRDDWFRLYFLQDTPLCEKFGGTTCRTLADLSLSGHLLALRQFDGPLRAVPLVLVGFQLKNVHGHGVRCLRLAAPAQSASTEDGQQHSVHGCHVAEGSP
mmetsp:Transcript_36161/g.83349  ORF Transcript_36161/g.83349 Transcript_36161/m.83349 type:complete len:115 (+) Transcript_36161:93-437(+)